MPSIEEYEAGHREMTLDDARRLTERIRIMAHSVADSITKLRGLVAEAKAGNVHVQLGYESWTAYLADVLGDTPMRLARDDRQEVSRMLTDEGMSTRAAAKVLGVSDFTIRTDNAGARFLAPEPVEIEADPTTGEVIEDDEAAAEPRTITGLDGKTYQRSEPQKPRRRPIADQSRTAGWELTEALERIERILTDDRFPTNKDEVATHLRSHLTNAIDSCQGFLDRINN